MNDIIERIQFANMAWVFIIPIALMGIDYATGILNAWLKGEIESKKMREGLAKKFGELCVLVIGAIFTFGLAIPGIILNFVSIYIMIMESVSICENLNKLGVPIPKFIKRALNEANEKIQNHDKKSSNGEDKNE